jgi:hypothetical protein
VLRADLENTFNRDFALALYARAIEDARMIKANADTFHQALMQNIPSAEARWCDQMGALLAGAWELFAGTPVTHAQAWQFYTGLQGIKELAEKSDTSIPKKALSAMLAYIPPGHSRPLGEHVDVLSDPSTGSWESKQDSGQFVGRYGLRVVDGYLYVSSNHPLLEKIFKDAGFPGYYNLLARIEGAGKWKTMRFPGQPHPSKTVRIPLPKLTDEERNPTYGTTFNRTGAAPARPLDDELAF